MKTISINVSRLETRADNARRYYHFCTIIPKDGSWELTGGLVPYMLNIASRFPESEGFKIDVHQAESQIRLFTMTQFIEQAPGAVK